MRNSPRMASRNFFGMALAAAMSATSAGWPGGMPARCTIAFSPYLPLLVSIASSIAVPAPESRVAAPHLRLPRGLVHASTTRNPASSSSDIEFTEFSLRSNSRPAAAIFVGAFVVPGIEKPCGHRPLFARLRSRRSASPPWALAAMARSARRIRLALSRRARSSSARAPDKLYLVVNSAEAIAYPVAVAKRGKEWSGWPRSTANMSSRRGRRPIRSSATTPNCPT